MNIKVKRLVISKSRRGKVYHSFRSCNMIDNKGTFWVEEEIKAGLQMVRYRCYLISKTKEISDYSVIIDIIESLTTSYKRDTKLKGLLDDGTK